MAKEGKKVGRGFGFYLIIMLLMLFGVFVAIVCAMIILPKTKILGYQYFTCNDSVTVEKLNTYEKDENGQDKFVDLDFSGLKQIEVNCGSSDVSISTIQKGKSSVKFTNVISAFAKANDNVDYSYSVDYYSYRSGRLKINVTEPSGFLNFSNNQSIQIVILGQDEETPVSIPTIKITTTSGDVKIGPETGTKLGAKSVTVETTSGNVYFSDGFICDYGDISVTTESGNIINNKTSSMALNSLDLKTKSGKVSLGYLACVNPIDASLGNGSLNFTTLNSTLNVSGKNFKIKGNLIMRGLSCETREMKKSDIDVIEVIGDVSVPYANESNISIIKVGGQVYIETTKGNVTIGGEYKPAGQSFQITRAESGISNQSFISTQSGKISALINDPSQRSHYFDSKSGEITLEFPTAVKSKNYVSSETGRVNIKIFSDYKFMLTFKNKNGDLYENLNSKLDISLILKQDFENPLKINGYSSDQDFVDIATDGRISCELLKYKNV